MRRWSAAGWVGSGVLSVAVLLGSAPAQLATRNDASASAQVQTARRTRLILKDGSYQIVMSYKVLGDRVQFVSAERGGEVEEVPLNLVDLDATRKWEQRHLAELGQESTDGSQRPAPILDPELAREERERAELTPEVAPDLHLVAEDSVLGMDTWQGTPELVPLMQSAGDLNKQTGHSILRGVMNPRAASHQVLVLKGEKAAVQMHVSQPEFYVRLDDDALPSGEALTVDTHGASASEKVPKPGAPSRYAIVRVDVRQDARVVASFSTSNDGTRDGSREGTRRQDDAVNTIQTLLPGGHWAKLVPAEPLLFGEYCLVEILGDNQINLSVWDFGVHPTAPENRDVLRPESPRERRLEHHPKDE